MIHRNLPYRFLRGQPLKCPPAWRSSRLQNSRFFFSKSVKKSVKRAVRVLRARSARASHARGACEAREKNMQNGQSVFLASLPRSRSLFSASFRTVCLTTRAYLNTQKYGSFCSLEEQGLFFTLDVEMGRPAQLSASPTSASPR